MTKLTARLHAWSDRVLLTPVLLGLAKPLQLLWAASALLAARLWRWLLRPVWRRLLRPLLWLPLRWCGQQLWRRLLRPVWRRLLRPAWSLLRWAGAVLLASPWLLARTLPNRGWLGGSAVLALTASVLAAPGVVNARTPDRLAPVPSGSSTHSLGALRPQVTVNLEPFSGWGLAPFDDQRRELVLKQDGAELRVLRVDGVQNAQDYLRWYAGAKLAVRDPGRLYPQRAAVRDAKGKPVQVVEIDQGYRAPSPQDPALSLSHQIVLYNYGTTVLLLVLSTDEQGPGTYGEQLRALKSEVRITP